jgi:glc operon protein GlcG
MPLTQQEARDLSTRIQQHAAAIGARLSVAIVDEGGHLRLMDRMDGAPPLSARVAPAKATSVALLGRDGADLIKLQQAWPAVFAQLDQIARTPIVAGAGARVIRRGDAVIGAVAVSGSTPQQDDECVDTALGLVSGAAA